MRLAYLVLALTLFVSLSPAWACDTAGPNTHLGVITAVDGGSVTLKDAQTGQHLKFVASPQLLKGVAVKDQVAIVFTPEGKTLRATAITKAGG
jgi:hypothetical protein